METESLTDNRLAEMLSRQRVLPVLRASNPAEALEAVDRCDRCGLQLVELTTTIPGWPGVLTEARRRYPRLVIGLGTVRIAEEAKTALEHAAAFLISPFLVPDVRALAEREGVVLVEAGLTPSEVARAATAGIAKLFPAHIGGPSYVRSLLTVLPDARLVPTGGISVDEVAAYLDAGALAVGMGSALWSEPAERLAALVGTL